MLSPIRIEIDVANRIFHAQNADVRVNDVDETGVAALQSGQPFALVEARPRRIQAGDAYQQLVGAVAVDATGLAANVRPKAVA